MWISLCILGGLFLYFQIIYDYAPLSPDFIGDMQSINAIVLVLSFLLCGFWVRRQFITQSRKIKEELVHTKLLVESIIPLDMQANIFTACNKKETKPKVIEHNYCAVVFVDFAGFTSFSLAMSDAELVNFLHNVYCEFDDIASQLNVTKIKTNGDQYIAAIGIEESKLNAYTISQLACDFSLQLQSAFAKACDNKIRLKIGIASGNVLCGVIGKLRPAFDLWGNSVNLASRLESSATGGEIRVCPQTMLYSMQHYAFSEEQKVQLKGIGTVTSYRLLGHK
jgi:class 3 adenylate cyclase